MRDNSNKDAWADPARVDLLKKLWGDGLSCSQIATELGGTTRNAVIGKLHRIGLDDDDREKPAKAPRARRRNDGGTTIRRINGRNGNADRSATQRIGKMFKVRQPSRGGVAMVDTVIRDEGPVPADFLCIALIDLEPHHCRFPRGGDEGEVISFCGQRKGDGQSYCGYHTRVCYQPPRPRVERSYLPTGGSKLRVF